MQLVEGRNMKVMCTGAALDVGRGMAVDMVFGKYAGRNNLKYAGRNNLWMQFDAS